MRYGDNVAVEEQDEVTAAGLKHTVARDALTYVLAAIHGIRGIARIQVQLKYITDAVDDTHKMTVLSPRFGEFR